MSGVEGRARVERGFAGDTRGVESGREIFEIAGEVPNGLADHFEVAYDRVDGLRVGLELRETQITDILFDFVDRFENVLDTKAPRPRRQEPPRAEFGRGAAA
jgi:hypothetical protein